MPFFTRAGTHGETKGEAEWFYDPLADDWIEYEAAITAGESRMQIVRFILSETGYAVGRETRGRVSAVVIPNVPHPRRKELRVP